MLSRKRLLLLLSAATALIVTALHSTPQEPETSARPAMRGAGGDVVVTHVIDGDTIELENGELVRYIGVDTPETRRRVRDRWVHDPEPFGREATEMNRRWVEGQRVRLEYDVQRRDKYGRLLAYVYVEDEMIPRSASAANGSSPHSRVAFAKGDLAERGMINAKLLKEGYAQLLTIPPNVKYVEEFRWLAAEAKDQRRGLWRDADYR